MSERAARLRAELHEEQRRFNALVETGDDFEATQGSLERCRELEGEIIEAEGESLLGDGSPRP